MRTGLWPLPPPKTTGRGDASGSSGGGGSFTPLSLSPLLWLTDDAGKFQSAGVPAVLDGDVIGIWQDQSGNANHGAQGTTAAKPIQKLAVQNGRSVVRFDGTDDVLTLTANITAAPVTVCAVARRVAAAGYRALLYMNKLGIYARMNATDNWGGFTNAEQLSGQNLNTMKIISYVNRLSNDADLVTNGVKVTVATGGVVYQNIGATTIGAVAGVQFMTGDLGELLVFSGALSDANRGLVETYLNAKWACF